MKLPKMQPTFRLEVPLDADEVVQRMRTAIDSLELRGQVVSAGRCIEFTIEASERRFWSPHLSVQVDEVESGSQIFGRFSPRPEVWTMFMLIYFICVFAIVAAAIYGYVQWFLGLSPWSLLAIPVGLVTIAGIHMASLVGQGLSRDQMDLLRQRLDRTVEIALQPRDT